MKDNGIPRQKVHFNPYLGNYESYKICAEFATAFVLIVSVPIGGSLERLKTPNDWKTLHLQNR